MRCWKSALQHIYEHHPSGSPAAGGPQSRTERGLADSLGQLELLCKERIDLLEALRLSRHENVSPGATPADAALEPSPEPGWIGEALSRRSRIPSYLAPPSPRDPP